MTRRVLVAAVTAMTLLIGAGAVSAPAASALADGNGTGHKVGRKAEHGKAVHHDVSAPLRAIPAARPVRRHDHPDSPMPTPAGPTVADPVVQQGTPPPAAATTTASFAGIAAGGSIPSDANGAVGPNHYFDLVNARLQIFNKDGSTALGPEPTNTLWAGFGGGCQLNDDGDGTVRYDSLADRWVVSQFSLGPAGNGPFLQCLAISVSADPTGSYYRYAFAFTDFPDYPKLGVWPDAYYQTMNTFGLKGSFLGATTCAYERTKMLDGQPAGLQCFNATTTYGAILPGDLDGMTPPPAGAPNMQIGLGTDNTHLASFAFHVDWTPGNAGTSLTESDVAVGAYTAACGAGICIPQAGTTQQLDSIADRMAYRYAYRNFGDHESWVVNYSVDVNGASAPRWFELRRTPPAPSGPLTVFQDSTYAPDSASRWTGSAAMDASGDIALGYSESSLTMKPAIAYTGRLSSDALNSMQPETVLVHGGGAQTSQNRWGDYSAMSVDPSDGCTFWYTNQYIPVDGNFNWQTQVAAFSFPSCSRRTDSDFSAALFPASATVAAPASVTATVSTARTAGTAQAVTLSATGLPAGVSASFSPTAVTAGSASTLTLTVGAATAPGSYSIAVNAAGTTTSHAATFTLTVPGAALTNGGFETGDLSGWRTVVGSAAVGQGAARSGAFGTVVGAAIPTNNDSSIAQSFTLSQPATLSLWYQIICPDTVTYDWATVTLRDETAGTQTTMLPKTCVTSSPWTQLTSVLGPASVGHAFTLVLTSHDDDFVGDATFTRFDDVALVPSTTPDFAVSAAPTSQTVVAGAGTSYSVATSVAGGFNGSIALDVSGLPSGTTGAFSPTPVLGAGTSTLSVTTSPSTPAGSYPLTITGTSGALSHTAPVTLIVNPAPDFSVSASPPSQTVMVGGGTSFSVPTSVVGGFNGWIDLSMDGLPDGALSAPTSVLGAGTSTLSITTSPSTPAGSYPLTITGTSGSLSHTTPVTLVVSPVPDFSVAASPPSQTVVAGGSTSYPVATSVVGAFDGPIDLSLSGLPAGATGTFSPTQVFGADFSTLSVTTTPLTTPGSYPLTITGTSGALGHSASVTLIVNPPGPGFAISVSPATQSVGRGKKVVYTVTVTPYGGFTGNVRLRIKMSSTGPTGAFSPISLRSGTSRLTVNGRHTVGTFRMTISGTNGGISNSAVATVIVTA